MHLSRHVVAILLLAFALPVPAAAQVLVQWESHFAFNDELTVFSGHKSLINEFHATADATVTIHSMEFVVLNEVFDDTVEDLHLEDADGNVLLTIDRGQEEALYLFEDVFVELPAGEPVTMRLSGDINPNAPPGSTFSMALALVGYMDPDGGAVASQGLPMLGPDCEVAIPLNLQVEQTDTFVDRVLPIDTHNVPMMTVAVLADREDELANITLTGDGTGNDATGVLEARIYHDADGDGLVSAFDPLLDERGYNADGGSLVFQLDAVTGVPFMVNDFAWVHFAIVYDFSVKAEGNDTYRAVMSGIAGLAPDLPLVSATVTMEPPPPPLLVVSNLQTSANDLVPGQQGAVVLHAEITGVNQASRVDSIDVTAIGTAPTHLALSRVRLVHDVNANGAYDPPAVGGPDQHLDDDVFFTPTDVVRLVANRVVPAGGAVHLLLVLDTTLTAAVGSTVGLSMTGLTSSGAQEVIGLPLTGSTYTFLETEGDGGSGGGGSSESGSDTGDDGGNGDDDDLDDPTLIDASGGCSAGTRAGALPLPLLLLIILAGLNRRRSVQT